MPTTSSARCDKNGRYDTGCRCDTCRERHARRQKEYRRRAAERRWGIHVDTTYVDPRPATAALLEAHLVHGVSRREICEVTGISYDSVHDIINQNRKWLYKQTSDIILRFYGPGRYAPRKIPDEQLVDVKPWVEWLDRLRAQGWTFPQLRKILEDNGQPGAFLRTDIRRNFRIRYENAKRIEWLVKTIGDRHGPSSRNKILMRKRGIFPLIHYTDDGRLIRGSLTEEQRAVL